MVEDLISWWLKYRIKFPRLFIIALEALTIPVMSDECERTFSSTKLVMGIQRVKLGDHTIEML